MRIENAGSRPKPRTDVQRKGGSPESHRSPTTDEVDGTSQPLRDSQSPRIFTSHPNDNRQLSKPNFIEESAQGSSRSREGNEECNLAHGGLVPTGERSLDGNDVAQPDRRVDQQYTHTQSDGGSIGREGPDGSSEESIAELSSSPEADGSDDGVPIDEPRGTGCGEAIRITQTDDLPGHCTSDGEPDANVEIVGHADGQNGDERTDIQIPVAHSQSIPDVPETDMLKDSEQQDALIDTDVSKDAPKHGLDAPEYSQINEPPDCPAASSAPEEQQKGGDGAAIGGEDAILQSIFSEPGALRHSDLPRSKGLTGTETLRESDVRSDSQGKGNSTSDRESAPSRSGRKHPTVYRDRRGLQRTLSHTPRASEPGESPPAKARLRLMLDLARRSARMSVCLSRPEGFPERIHPLLGGEDPVEAFDMSRYDDIDVSWTADLLDGELRIQSREGQQWLRSARSVHIFAESPAEAGLVSVGAARPGIPHVVVCKVADEESLRRASAATGSSHLTSHERWHGIPDGWAVFSEYNPIHSATPPLPAHLRTLDPGTEVAISLSGRLPIQDRVYAEVGPPRVVVAPLPDVVSVTIDGVPARQASDGTWEAEGWDRPGQHLIDVVPGPSLSYQIMADPAANPGWQFWDAHPERFGSESSEPWSRAMICGTAVRGRNDETIIAAASLPILVAIGHSRDAMPLTPRLDVPASVAVMAEAPSFLVAATGIRRTQGRVVWLGSTAKPGSRSIPDRHWAETVRSLAARRLRLDGADPKGEHVWRTAKQQARRIWKKR